MNFRDRQRREDGGIRRGRDFQRRFLIVLIMKFATLYGKSLQKGFFEDINLYQNAIAGRAGI